jgi:hypothetical protein
MLSACTTNIIFLHFFILILFRKQWTLVSFSCSFLIPPVTLSPSDHNVPQMHVCSTNGPVHVSQKLTLLYYSFSLPVSSTGPYQQVETQIDNNSVVSARELYRPSDRRLSAKLVPTFADRWYYVVNMTNPYANILGFSSPEPILFLPSSSSVVLTRLSGPRFRPKR